MSHHYKIRTATCTDKQQIHTLMRESIAREKRLNNPSQVPFGFMEEFVDKVIRKGNMIVVENDHHELELIGEVHNYQIDNQWETTDPVKEFIFFSRMDISQQERETELVNWLFGEIENKHQDVFRVKVNTPVRNSSSVDHYKKMGLTIEGNYNGRLKNNPGQFQPLIPLSWTNPSFN